MKRYTVTVQTEDLSTRERTHRDWTVIAVDGRAASNDVSNVLAASREAGKRSTVQGVKEWRG